MKALLLLILLSGNSLFAADPISAARSVLTIKGNMNEELDRKMLSEGFVKIPGGTFLMGSTNGKPNEAPIHPVTISPFYMLKTEITQAEYRRLMNVNPSFFKGDSLPVEEVSRLDAIAYCNERSRVEGMPQCYSLMYADLSAGGYRLPTEAEYEYAARAGEVGDPSDIVDSISWYAGNSDKHTHPVGSKKPNAFGLYDMNGNVWEWCSDWHGPYSDSAIKDPVGPVDGSDGISRGGSWDDGIANLRITYRRNVDPSDTYRDLGFRIVVSIRHSE